MKSKKIENKKFYSKHLSPNFNIKKKRNINFVIIHYTGMLPIKKTIEKFKDSKSKVSCHWLISSKGKIYKIVDEKNEAWHCGKSRWKKFINLNKCSVGIELDNPGHGSSYKTFPNTQMNALAFLLKKILVKYNINNKNVLGHSDISPERKLDPGEFFDWHYLAKKKLAYFPPIKKKILIRNIFFQIGDKGNTILELKILLKKIGYACILNSKFDIKFKLIIEAFQRRFLPVSVNGIIDDVVYQRIIEVYKNS